MRTLVLVNIVKTFALVSALAGAVGLFAYLVGGIEATAVAAGMVLLLVCLAYVQTERLILEGSGIRKFHEREDPRLLHLLDALAAKAEIPTPRLYVLDVPSPNAFAVGVSPNNSSIVVTSGLLDALGRDELAGVLSHELAHIRDRDTLIMTSIAALAALLIAAAIVILLVGLVMGRGRGLLLSLVALAGAASAAMIAFAIGREREYRADLAGAEICGHPEWLISALRTIGMKINSIRATPGHLHGVAVHLLFVAPVPELKWTALLASHPPIAARIARLEQARKIG